MWLYDQSSGDLYRCQKIAKGYSGFNAGKNNPDMENVRAVGPIPKGKWNIGEVYNSKNVGPFAIVLTPDGTTETFDRSAFRIHGDSIKNPGTASRGCIILPRVIREQIVASGDKTLLVVE